MPERNAMDNAVDKLEIFGPQLPYPHQSNVRGADDLRELRPRAGRSPWRAFYRRIGDNFVIGAIGPEAEANPHGFRRAVRAAVTRLDGLNLR
ncbi:MAG: type II toxin-antitoxin system RelE/ParE family toxin [Actinomycetota bacterium]